MGRVMPRGQGYQPKGGARAAAVHNERWRAEAERLAAKAQEVEAALAQQRPAVDPHAGAGAGARQRAGAGTSYGSTSRALWIAASAAGSFAGGFGLGAALVSAVTR